MRYHYTNALLSTHQSTLNRRRSRKEKSIPYFPAEATFLGAACCLEEAFLCAALWVCFLATDCLGADAVGVTAKVVPTKEVANREINSFFILVPLQNCLNKFSN